MITFFKTSGNILDFPLTYINTIIGLDNRIVLNLACPRAPLAFLSHLKLPFPSLSNACHTVLLSYKSSLFRRTRFTFAFVPP